MLSTLLVFALMTFSAQAQTSEPLSITSTELPAASLWEAYGENPYQGLELRASGGVGRHHWQMISGSLPKGTEFTPLGAVKGAPQEVGEFQFTILVTDSNNPQARAQKLFTLRVDRPLRADWDRDAHVNGQRIDGSVKVSNTTGRDFDLTFVVLAVNDIGRATAIGYQHFPLKKHTRDLDLPFGDNLSPGNYVVHVDLVGEEPVSRAIFRTRLVSPKQTLSQGP